MTWRNKRDHINNYTCKWRNSDLGKTKPNHHYFMRLLKNETLSFLRENKEYLLNNKPEIYYSMMSRKLPKKYLKKNTVVTPVNSYVPPQSKLSSEELDKQLEQEAIARKQKEQALKEKQQKEMKEKERVERNRAALAREQRRIFWCNAYEQGNYVSIHCDRYKRREKKYEYY